VASAARRYLGAVVAAESLIPSRALGVVGVAQRSEVMGRILQIRTITDALDVVDIRCWLTTSLDHADWIRRKMEPTRF
jgi:hypothetical protein